MHARKLLVTNNIRFKHNWVKPEGYDTGIRVYNCVAKEKVPLIMRNKYCASWYTCGPTVYGSAHIGHASCYVKLDIIQRILKNYFNINVVAAMNITDIDDKIINKSRQAKTSVTEIAQLYEKEFWEDMDSLKIMKPNLVVRVTENIQVIENFIKQLLVSKHAYKTEDGSVLFDIKTKNAYGKLQNITPKDSPHVSDEIVNSKIDFTMWKVAKPNEPFWNIECGSGRPGWHTECSALASGIFGSSIDIHAGGVDLRFPHHENEEVQCCAYFSKSQWVNYWLHTGHLLQNLEKMSKSLNNTVSIRDMLQICSADVFRIMCLMSHYRHNMEFSKEYVASAEKLLESYKNFVVTCNACIAGKLNPCINVEDISFLLKSCIDSVHNSLSNDFDTSSCIKTINSLISSVNKMLHSSVVNVNTDLSTVGAVVMVLNFVVNVFNVFGVDLNHKSAAGEQSDDTELINILTEFRQSVRSLGIESKNQVLLQLCDGVRDVLKKYGVTIRDHGKLSSWSK